MDEISERFKNPIIASVLGFLVGLIIGWFLLGWGIWPVKWVNAGPSNLEPTWREDYMRMAINDYAQTNDQELAKKRWGGFEGDASEVYNEIVATPEAIDSAAIGSFGQAVGASSLPGGEAETDATDVTDEGEDTSGEGSGSRLTIILALCGVVSVLAVAVVVYLFLFNRRGSRFSESVSPAAQAQEYTRQAEPTDYSARGDAPPMSQFMTTYMMGDDLFDDSFSIDSPAGEFLGECGIGISEAIGVGEPKKVAAFEVWLFDKNDIQTVTKVLMSEHAYSDNTLRERLEKKGEPFLAEPGSEMILETATLRLVARVVDIAYGSSGTPQRSFFERLTLELAVWEK